MKTLRKFALLPISETLLSKTYNENSIYQMSKHGCHTILQIILALRFLCSTVTELLLKLKSVKMEETGLPFNSKQTPAKSLVAQLIPSHVPLHSQPTFPPGASSFASREAAVPWGPLSQQRETVVPPQSTHIDAVTPAKLTLEGFDLFNSYCFFHLCVCVRAGLANPARYSELLLRLLLT